MRSRNEDGEGMEFDTVGHGVGGVLSDVWMVRNGGHGRANPRKASLANGCQLHCICFHITANGGLDTGLEVKVAKNRTIRTIQRGQKCVAVAVDGVDKLFVVVATCPDELRLFREPIPTILPGLLRQVWPRPDSRLRTPAGRPIKQLSRASDCAKNSIK